MKELTTLEEIKAHHMDHVVVHAKGEICFGLLYVEGSKAYIFQSRFNGGSPESTDANSLIEK